MCERSGTGALGWSVPLHVECDAECHLGPADAGQLVLEAGIAVSS